jgi:hypothetical protein
MECDIYNKKPIFGRRYVELIGSRGIPIIDWDDYRRSHRQKLKIFNVLDRIPLSGWYCFNSYVPQSTLIPSGLLDSVGSLQHLIVFVVLSYKHHTDGKAVTLCDGNVHRRMMCAIEWAGILDHAEGC